MSLYKLSNQIFTLGLDAQEMSVYAYLCSLPSLQDMIDGAATVYVKQSTIAANCGPESIGLFWSDRNGELPEIAEMLTE